MDTENAESNDLMPFKNLFNEWFVRDTSRKIRAVQRAKAQRGERLGTRAPYGYKKDENAKGKLVVDEEAALWCVAFLHSALPAAARVRLLNS